MRSLQIRLGLALCATVATVAALFALHLDAESGTRLVAALLSFLVAQLPRPRPPRLEPAPVSAAQASFVHRTMERSVQGLGVYLAADLAASFVGA